MGEPRLTGEVYGYSFDDVFYDILTFLSRSPEYVCSPRGQKIKECLVTTLVLENPRARLITSPSRKANYGFATGEFLWYWTGREDLEMMQYYNKRSDHFSNNGETINSAYGKRMLVDVGRTGITQWDACVKTLRQDPDSRRAILLINRPEDQASAALFGSKDVPCTLSLQFFVRENELQLHVNMRSNDVIWGLTNDLFSFTLFQECMLLELRQHPEFKDLELGTYYHTAGSIHLYERHFQLAEDCIKDYEEKRITNKEMTPISSLKGLARLVEDESGLRLFGTPIDKVRHGLASAELWMSHRLDEHRQKRDAEETLRNEQKAEQP